MTNRAQQLQAHLAARALSQPATEPKPNSSVMGLRAVGAGFMRRQRATRHPMPALGDWNPVRPIELRGALM